MVDQSDSLHLSAPQLFHSHIIVRTAINLTSHFMRLISPLMSRQLQFQFVWYCFLEKLQRTMSELVAVSCHCFHSPTGHTHALAVVLSSVTSNWGNVVQNEVSDIWESGFYSQGLLPVDPFHYQVYSVSSTDKVVFLPKVKLQQANTGANLHPNLNCSVFAGLGKLSKISILNNSNGIFGRRNALRMLLFSFFFPHFPMKIAFDESFLD